MKIELGKTYLDRSGEKVRIVCVDSDNDKYPIIGLFGVDGKSWAHEYAPSGSFYHPDDEPGENRRDLISEYTPPAPLLECWVNVSPSGDYGAAWESESAAQESCRDTTCRTVHFREVRDDHA